MGYTPIFKINGVAFPFPSEGIEETLQDLSTEYTTRNPMTGAMCKDIIAQIVGLSFSWGERIFTEDEMVTLRTNIKPSSDAFFDIVCPIVGYTGEKTLEFNSGDLSATCIGMDEDTGKYLYTNVNVTVSSRKGVS